jgi:alpha-L-arabinofuranosidase
MGSVFANPPDSVYIKAFSTGKNNHKNGLHIAYSVDKKAWKTIGDDFSFLKSDYGMWSAEKRMLNPQLWRDNNGLWYCLFDVNETAGVQGVASSRDLILWKPQDYFVKGEWSVPGRPAKTDTIFKVSWAFLQNLLNRVQLTGYNNRLYAETTAQDSERFAGLKNVHMKITPDFSNPKKISDKLLGVFFEDINYAADGGLYAEWVQNRDFEYSSTDRKEWNGTTAWKIENGEWKMENKNPLHPNNPHYIVLQSGETIINEGYDGIAVKAGEKYDFSAFAFTERNGKMIVKLIDDEGNAVSREISIHLHSKNWKKSDAVITANKTLPNARLAISIEGTAALDMISLFPQKTFKNRKNGLRADLAQAIADIKPRFVRFPGGCVVHGQGIENIYNWKNSIGKLEERKPDFNLWGYHQTKGLGYFEYFQFCEDIGAEPLPVLAAGVPCQNSAHHGHPLGGQQGGIPLDEMDAYIQDILDLIEWANGDKSTKWGKVRADAGHPQPFHLKYIGIGNEDLISEVFKVRFEMIWKAIREKHPEMTVIGTTGPFYEGSDYAFGWDFASKQHVPMVDEHYYVPPAWIIYNPDYYDKYDRSKPKVYLGEYAAHLSGRPNNMETALAEALLLCNVERNGDIVAMTSYAPLLAKEHRTQWNPDLIYFNNTEVKPAVGYYVQKLFGENAGDEYIPAATEFSTKDEKACLRMAHSIVKDNKTGDYIIKLVNLLPMEATVSFENWKIGDLKIEKSVLQGNPGDKNVQPARSSMTVSKTLEVNLPAYSFTVIRMKT